MESVCQRVMKLSATFSVVWRLSFFVLIWSTGFIIARLVAPYADPLSFLALRYLLVIAILAPAAWWFGAQWPGTIRDWRDGLITGVLLHGIYLGGRVLGGQAWPAGGNRCARRRPAAPGDGDAGRSDAG